MLRQPLKMEADALLRRDFADALALAIPLIWVTRAKMLGQIKDNPLVPR